MVLLVPNGATSFGSVQSNVVGQPLNTVGAVMTPVVGSKGAWVQVFASLTDDTYGLAIQLHNARTSAANRSYAVDVGIGAAGAETVLIPDLIGSNAGTMDSIGPGIWYYFPVFIPAGTRVAVRAQGSVTTSIRANVFAMQQPANPSMVKTCGYVEELGLTGIVGTALTAGTTAEGAWTLVGTTTSDLWWWQVGAQVPVATVAHNLALVYFDIAVGDGTNFRVIADSLQFQTTTTEEAGQPLRSYACESYVPAGSNIYVRGQAGATPTAYQVAVYGAG